MVVGNYIPVMQNASWGRRKHLENDAKTTPTECEKTSEMVSSFRSWKHTPLLETCRIAHRPKNVLRYWKESLGVEAGTVVVNPLYYHEEDNDV